MHLKYDFKTIEVVGETLAVPVGKGTDEFHGALRVNEVTADILELLKSDTTEDAVIDAMLREYKASREEIAENVHRIVDQLKQAGLLTE